MVELQEERIRFVEALLLVALVLGLGFVTLLTVAATLAWAALVAPFEEDDESPEPGAIWPLLSLLDGICGAAWADPVSAASDEGHARCPAAPPTTAAATIPAALINSRRFIVDTPLYGEPGKTQGTIHPRPDH